MVSLAPKSIRNFKKRNAYNSKYDAGIGFHHHDLAGRHSHMVLSMDKNKDGNKFGLKIALDSKIAQSRVEKEAARSFNALFPHAAWTNQWATSGGMLYRVWPSKNFAAVAGKTAEAKILRAIKHVILFADKEMTDK